jgi:hypothetical protein
MTLRVTYRLSSTEAEEANSWLSSSALSRCQSLKSYCPQSRPMRCRVEPAAAADRVGFKLGGTSLFVNPAVVWVGLARPNPRLQRTPSRAPLSRKPLDDTRSGECGVKSSPSRAPRLCEPGETRRIRAATPASSRRAKSSLSSNLSLHRTPAAQLSSFWLGVRPAPVSSKPLGAAVKLWAGRGAVVSLARKSRLVPQHGGRTAQRGSAGRPGPVGF